MPWITSFGYGWQGQHPKVWAPMESPKGSAMKSFLVIKKKKKKKIRCYQQNDCFLAWGHFAAQNVVDAKYLDQVSSIYQCFYMTFGLMIDSSCACVPGF